MPMTLFTILLITTIFLEVALLILLIAFISKPNNKNSKTKNFKAELERIKEQIERK